MEPNRRFILIIAMIILLLGKAYAQERSIGSSWSFSGMGVSYEHPMKQDTFLHVGAQVEMAEMFLGRTTKAGGSFSFTYNDVLRRMTSRNCNNICIFAGAGAALGYSKDCRLRRTQPTYHGCFFGLKGRAGIRIEYNRKINITAAVAPVLGMHLSVKDETVMMRYYRYGLLQTLMPELTVGYRF